MTVEPPDLESDPLYRPGLQLTRPFCRFVDDGSEMIDDCSDSDAYIDQIENCHRTFAAAERYVDGGAWIHLHFRLRGTGFDFQNPRDFCGVVVAAPVADPLVSCDAPVRRHDDGERAEHGDRSFAIVEAKPSRPEQDDLGSPIGGAGLHAGRDIRSVDRSMLVQVVQMGEQGEGMPRNARASSWVESCVVRLRRLDECAIYREHALYPDFRLLPPLGVCFVDGELSGFLGCSGSRFDQMPEHVVQGRPKEVGELSDRHSPLITRDAALNAEDVITGLHIQLSNNGPLFSEERVPYRVEQAQLLVGAAQLDVDPFEIRSDRRILVGHG